MYEVVKSAREIGYGFIESCFDESEINLIKDRIDDYISKHQYGVVYEKDGSTIRGVHGLHIKDAFFDRFIKDSRFLNLVEEYLGNKCYLHQFKINYKRALKGESWPWHQDFPFWKEGDGILTSNLINVAVLIDDVSMMHGPLCMIPKSHMLGNISTKHTNNKSWESDVSSNLTYQVEKKYIDKLMMNNECEFITGKSGDVFIFDPLTIHASGTNLSANDRRLLILTYNSVDNLPTQPALNRPDFLVGNDFSPLSATNTPLG